jgi:glycosyltransferase involved in cell wall biosynthesis
LCTVVALTNGGVDADSRLRILQISSAKSFGGGERHLADLANGLALRGHEIFYALRRGSPLLTELDDASRVTIVPLRNSFDAQSARTLSRLVRKNDIQIIHAHMARDYPLAAYAARTNPNAKLIVTRHVLFPLSRLHRLTLARAARIIAVSAGVASALERDGVATAKKISVVLNGIDVSKFATVRAGFDRQIFLDSWKLPRETLLVGTVGELTPLKGQEEFLQAARAVVNECPHAYFIIAGTDHSADGKHRGRLEQLIAELDLSDHARLVGWLEDSAAFYCGLDLFVSASHTESFGLAIAEAMASGAAVLATATDGARELVTAGETGFLVPIGDVAALASNMSRLLAEPAERKRIGLAAQETARERFSVDRMITETEKIYEAALETTARRSSQPE